MKLIPKLCLIIAALSLSFTSCEPVNDPENPGTIVPPDPGLDPEPNPDPEPDIDPIKPHPSSITFSEIIEKGSGNYEVKSAVVVAAGSFNFVVTDGTAYMLLYDPDKTISLGDELSLDGEVKEFNGVPEWNKPSMELVSSDRKFNYTEPEEITEAFIRSQASKATITYGKAVGTKNGYKVSVGAEVLYTYSNIAVPDGDVTIYGYTIGYASKYDNVNFVITKYVPSEIVDPDPDPDPDPEPNPDPDPNPGPSSNRYSWAELPLMYDEDNNGVHDNDSNIYYATHFTDLKSPSGGDARNYTVCFSGEHHCPIWVAAPRHSMYQNKGTDRTNAYKVDPKIPSDVQYHSKTTGGGCNKGHMLGSAERLASRKTNEQVFYYTNIAPQLQSGFNTGGGGWNTLEEYVDGQVCSDTLYIVVGCYFEKFTDGYGNTVSPKTISFGGRNDVDMPTMFYYALLRTKKGNTKKSLKNCSASEMKCAAFVRSHTNDLKGQKVTSREMMSISDLEKITGIKYFENVPNAPKTSFSASEWGL